jgi:hypothetical protein
MTSPSEEYEILAAVYPFVCNVCDAKVRKGENYIIRDGLRTCLKCGLPERRLRPVTTKEKQPI